MHGEHGEEKDARHLENLLPEKKIITHGGIRIGADANRTFVRVKKLNIEGGFQSFHWPSTLLLETKGNN